MPDHPEFQGGLGGDSAPRDDGIRDTRLQERAIRERWPMPRGVRVKVLQRLVNIVDPDAWEGASDLERPGVREQISAAKALLAADKINLDEQRLELAREALQLRHPPEGDDGEDYVIDLSPDDEPEPEPDPPAPPVEVDGPPA